MAACELAGAAQILLGPNLPFLIDPGRDCTRCSHVMMRAVSTECSHVMMVRGSELTQSATPNRFAPTQEWSDFMSCS